MHNHEEFKFVGPKSELDPNRETAKKALQQLYADGRKEIPGEIEKSEFYNEAIRTVNQILSLIYRRFDIKDGKFVDTEQIHFLHKKEFDEHADPRNAGSYLSTSGTIFINVDFIGENKAYLLSTLLHECLHAVSNQYFFVDINEDGIDIFDARVGLRTSSQWKKPRTELRGLNEFFVNTAVCYSLGKVAKTLESRFGVTASDLESPIYSDGGRHNFLFEALVEKMLESGKVNKNFLSDIVRSNFSGSLKSLAPIDQVFGPGSIRVLGYLDTFGEGEMRESVNKLVQEYFLQADETRRKEIAKELDNMEE